MVKDIQPSEGASLPMSFYEQGATAGKLDPTLHRARLIRSDQAIEARRVPANNDIQSRDRAGKSQIFLRLFMGNRHDHFRLLTHLGDHGTHGFDRILKIELFYSRPIERIRIVASADEADQRNAEWSYGFNDYALADIS